jgi:hypothetical protein
MLFFNRFHQIKDGKLLCLCLDVNRNTQVQPGIRKVIRINIIMMTSRISILPGVQGAGNVKKRLTVPGFQGLSGRIFDIATVGQAAVMMQVVYERNFQSFANGQQITGRVHPIIVFQCQAAADAFRQTSNLTDQTFQRLTLVPVGTSGMNIDHIRTDPVRDLRLVSQIGNGTAGDLGVWGRQEYKLIRVKAGAQIVSAAIRFAFFECVYNFSRLGQVLYLIAEERMRFERQNLAVNSKSTNIIMPAKLKRLEKRSCVMPADIGKMTSALNG